MLGKLIPVILGLVGIGAGVGAGIVLRPSPEAAADVPCPCAAEVDVDGTAEGPDGAGTDDAPEGDETPTKDYVKLNNQFIVPVVADGRVSSLVVMSLSLEVAADSSEDVYAREPKLRDVFLRVMFDHANSGGFSGAFTQSGQMDVLRNALREVARKTMGPSVTDVLILDIVRQDA